MACIELFRYLNKFCLGYNQWQEVYSCYHNEFEKSLLKHERDGSMIKCTPGIITQLPNGKEDFKCLGIVLGLELRCLLLALNGSLESAEITTVTYSMPEDLQRVGEDDCFDYIVSCLCDFAQEQNVDQLYLPLGVTFESPGVHPGALDNAMERLYRAFNYADYERKDVHLLLTVALAKNRQLETCQFNLITQSSALLILCVGLINPDCIAVVTEYGGAYIEHVDQLEFLTAEQKRKCGTHTIVEIDWAKFADGQCLNDIINEFDLADGKVRVFEKMIAGRHRCDLFQKIVHQLLKDDVLFPMHPDRADFIKMLQVDGCFKIDDLEILEEDEIPDFTNTKEFIKRMFGIDNVAIEDCFRLRYICQSLAKRAAQMVGILISSLINKFNRAKVFIGLSDRLFRLKERYDIVTGVIFMLVSPLLRYEIIHIKDDVGIGAALTAGMAVRH